MTDKRRDRLALLLALFIPLAVGGLSAFPTMSAIPGWYRWLRKPRWTPPAWLFAPVWNILYVMMGVASWLVWKLGWGKTRVREALALFAVQLGLNALWSIVFFGLRAPGLALAEIVVLWSLIAATFVRFYRLRPAAGLLLLPYLLWTTFAATLNASIWWLNRAVGEAAGTGTRAGPN